MIPVTSAPALQPSFRVMNIDHCSPHTRDVSALDRTHAVATHQYEEKGDQKVGEMRENNSSGGSAGLVYVQENSRQTLDVLQVSVCLC
jgi:hypothetical protein